MNLENFADYLKYPSRLYQLPYEELKSLTMQYPYCSNFHLLLLIKSKLEGHPDLEKNLAKAATYTIDRKFLWKIMQEKHLLRAESQLTVGEDEILELKDLFTLEPPLEKIPVRSNLASQENTPSAITFDLFPEKPGVADQEDDLDLSLVAHSEGGNSEAEIPESTPAESFSENRPLTPDPEDLSVIPGDVKDNSDIGMPDAAEKVPEYEITPELIAQVSTILGITQHWVAPEKVPAVIDTLPDVFQVPDALLEDCIAINLLVAERWEHEEKTLSLEWDIPVYRASTPAPGDLAPTPKSKFSSYRKRYLRPSIKEVDLPHPPTETVRESPREARKVAEESVREDLGVASETLAGLLVQQHQYDRAVKMYEHLSLLIPEKNTYFAAKIDEIKKL